LLAGDKRFGDHRLDAGRTVGQRMFWSFVDPGTAVHMIGGFNSRGFAQHLSFLNGLLARSDSIGRSLSLNIGEGEKYQARYQNDLFHEELSLKFTFILIRNILNTKVLKNNTSKLGERLKSQKPVEENW